jgi:uncharacterized protein (TIGR03067 family)
MRILITACVLLGTLVGAAATRSQEAKKGTPELQGTWKLIAHITSQDTYDVPGNFPRWVIKDDQIRYGGQALATLTVDTANMPKTIDMHFTESKKTYEGVYKIDGDTLTICINRLTAGVKERPLDFAAESKEDRQLLVLQKLKRGAGDGSKDAPGFVGVQIGKAPDDMGVIIVAVIDKSPAKKAGLMKDDVILQVGADEATGVVQVVDAVRAYRPGSELKLHIRRGEKEQDVTVRVGVLPFMLLQ